VNLQLFRIAEFIGASGQFDGESLASGYSIDSRTISQGQLFFAVKGEQHDGHDFVSSALKAGAVAAVVSRASLEKFPEQKNLMVVEDTLLALQTLGAAVRRLWNKPLIAVTGSAGKTTTKEAIAAVLGSRKRVLKSAGNLNNHFGLPLQLLRLEPQYDIAVVELGMNHAGEIAALARIAKPDCGVVTCVAPVHLEFFENIAAIARAKFELIESVHAGGTAVLNADDEYVSQFGRDFHGKVITYGIKHAADVSARDIKPAADGGSDFQLVVDGVPTPAHLPLLGRHNVMNALAAVATGLQFGITPTDAAAALGQLRPADKRGEMLQLSGATLINDCYNSNPLALKSMVDVLAGMPAKRRIVVAGEMLELGPAAADLHRECGRYMAGKVDIVIAVRGLAAGIAEAAGAMGVRSSFVPASEEAGEVLATELRPGDVVLLKASRGVRLEKALETLQRRLEKSPSVQNERLGTQE
jgi:UDP-N-acetylmuramoyl-tripeptide--D-alanyl-D-alanine ligase